MTATPMAAFIMDPPEWTAPGVAAKVTDGGAGDAAIFTVSIRVSHDVPLGPVQSKPKG